jgi:DNA-binding response OmpR family regulator
MAAAFSEAIRADGVRVGFFSSMDEARRLIAKNRPWLAIVEHDPPRVDGLQICRAIRHHDNHHERQLPVILIAAQEDQVRGAAAGVTDWLIKPFSDAYAQTKIRTWVLRTASQWMRRAMTQDQEWHLAGPPVKRRRRADAALMPQNRIANKRYSENVISTEKSALLWMYCKEIAPFETPAFSKKVGELIAGATKHPT